MTRFDDNKWLDTFIGATFKQKAVHAAQRYLMEQKLRHLGYKPMISETSLVTITDKHRQILGMAGSKPSDLVLDQFGAWLAGFIRAVTVGGTVTAVTMKADSGIDQTVNVYGGAGFNINSAGTRGTQIKVGSGSTAPARTNYAIQTDFGTAPESGYFDTNTGSYAVGVISLSGAITAGGAGTINEDILVGVWINSNSAQNKFALFRDAVSPGVAFVAGGIINVAWTINL